MGMRLAMASMPSDGEVQKAPIIQRAALRCIFFSSVMFLTIGTVRGLLYDCLDHMVGFA